MAEWSKALVSGTSHFDGLGSNPTPVIPHCYTLAGFAAKRQFENNKQHTFNGNDYIGRMAELSKALVSDASYKYTTLLQINCFTCLQSIRK